MRPILIVAVLMALCAHGADRSVLFTPDWSSAVQPVGRSSEMAVMVREADGELATNGFCRIVVDDYGSRVMLETNVDLSVCNPYRFAVTRDTPGFVRIQAEEKFYGIAFEPGRIAPAVPKPSDFESFWREAFTKAEREVPLDVKLTKVEAQSTEEFDMFRLSVATTSGRRVHGFLSVPRGAASGTRYPIVFEMPGAGCGMWANRIGGRKDAVVLFLSVFPFEPCGDEAKLSEVKRLYEEQDRAVRRKWGVQRYAQAGLSARREDFFYYPVIIGAVRALRWVCAQEYVDATDVRYNGTSQGGGMGLAMTALSGCITRATIYVPALTGLLDGTAGRQSGWPQPVENHPAAARAFVIRNAPYFDGVNFASMITCPIRFVVGFADQSCAPHAVYSAYNICPSADKDIVHGVGMGHAVTHEIYRELGQWLSSGEYPDRRPKPENRCFRSAAVDAKIAEIVPRLTNRKLAWMFSNCFPNTLDTTVHYRQDAKGDDETFVYTGDIPAMWLRDSAAQVWPYLGLVKNDEPLRRMIRGVVRKQLELVRVDRYANAFNDVSGDALIDTPHDGVRHSVKVFERKYELDSLCYPLRLAHGYWKASGDASVFDDDYRATVRLIVDTIKEQQRKNGFRTPYFFARKSYRNNAVANSGWGRQTRPVGLVVSSFRPSDDATELPFLVPSNFMAENVLRKAAEIACEVSHEQKFSDACVALADEIRQALEKHALLVNPETGRRQWAFEVDGYGSALFMDDANVPSLIALPYFASVPRDDPFYLATRDFVWSEMNPYFHAGTAITGIGGPHCEPGTVWPMSLILRALTATDDDDVRQCLEGIIHSDAGTGFVHESVGKDDQKLFSRNWFAWANTLFGELIYRLYEEGKIGLLNSVR